MTELPNFEERRCPYQGLIPFDEQDREFFFGRDLQTRLIVANLFASPLSLVYGPSGVGKTSVLQAGVVPALRRRNDVIVVVFREWQGDPLGRLKARIAQATGVTVAGTRQWTDTSLGDHIDNCLGNTALQSADTDPTPLRMMVVLDQFEEYFLYQPRDEQFARELARAVMRRDLPVNWLVSMREDFLASLDKFEATIPILLDNLLRIEYLDRRGATEAIERPLAEFNRRKPEDPDVAIEPQLVDAVIEQVRAGRVTIGLAGKGDVKPESTPESPTTNGQVRVATPFLQMVLLRLWDEEIKKGSHVLRETTLESLGGANEIVRRHLDKAMDQLNDEQRAVCALFFDRLVTPTGTKIACTVDDLTKWAGDQASVVPSVLEALSSPDLRILRGVDIVRNDMYERGYEIFHDVLAPAILQWRARYMGEKVRVAAVCEADAQRHRAEHESHVAARLRKLSHGLVGAAMVAVLIAGFALWARRDAQIARADAESQKQLLEAATKLRDALEDEAFVNLARAEKAEAQLQLAQAEAEAHRQAELKARVASLDQQITKATNQAAQARLDAAKFTDKANTDRAAYGLPALNAPEVKQRLPFDEYSDFGLPSVDTTPAPGPAEPAPPPPAPVSKEPTGGAYGGGDEAGVRAALASYEHAYDTQDIEALKAVYPTLPNESQLAQVFRDFNSYDLILQLGSIELSPNRQTATASATVSSSYVGSYGARSTGQKRGTIFTLEKQAGVWKIVRVETK